MKKTILTVKAPKPIGPYSQAIRHNDLIFCSGQLPINPETGEIKGISATEQTNQVMENLKEVLLEGGSSFENVLKTTIYLKNMGDFASVNEVYARYFTENPPARATVEVSNLPKNALVEIEVVACKK